MEKKKTMIYPVYIYGSPVLRQVTEEVADRTLITPELIDDMFETMYASDGVGLAAPQIGKSLRLFVLDSEPYMRDDPQYDGFREVFINPHIYEASDEEIALEEGCLSVPGIHEMVTRPERIRIRYFDAQWQPHDREFEGRVARIIQHEYDHLEGKIFTDHIAPLRKTMLRNKLTGMTKGRYSADYKTKLVK